MSSRESDKASPNPRRSGGDAYPSGTPPYGVPKAGGAFGADGFGPGGPAGPDGGSPGGAEQPAADEGPRTETTLTTRVRINIPGSRPIPPVVVRSPVKDAAKTADQSGAKEGRPGAGGGDRRPAAASPGVASSPVLGVMDTEGSPSVPPNLPPEWRTPDTADAPQSSSESTGEWFRPRKKTKSAAETAAPPAATPPPAGRSPFDEPVAFNEPAAFNEPPAFDEPAAGPTVGGTGTGIPRPAAPGFPASPRPGGAPASPFAPAPPQGAGPDDSFPGAPGGAAGAFPADTGVRGPNPFGDGPGPQRRSPAPAPGPFQQPAPSPQAYGDDPFGTRPAGAGLNRPYDPALADTAIGGLPRAETDSDQDEPTMAFPAATEPLRPGPYGADPFAARKTGGAPGWGPSAVDFPEEAFRPGPAGGPRSGGPVTVPVPPEQDTDAPDGKQAAAPAAPRRRGRGRKLVAYGLGLVVGAAGVAYGAGLMLNQADVPKGTTVLGTSIGGSSRDAAVHTLDTTVAKIGQQPIRLRVDGREISLDPATAGLSFDTTATVDQLTHHSYNPMEVVGSLTGRTNAVEPQVRIDPDKLRAALTGLASRAGQGPTEGYVYFTQGGRAVPVLPKAGKSIDVDSAVQLVEQAYEGRAAGRQTGVIDLKVTTARPKVSAAAIQAAASGLGQKIISGGLYHVTAGASELLVGPRTFSQTLRLVPNAAGKVVPRFDLNALQSIIAARLAGYQVKHGATAGPITAQDVATALVSVLDKTGTGRSVALPVVTG